MFNKDFYSTPYEVIAKMVFHVEHILQQRVCKVLEPSAGKGNICDYIVKHYGIDKRFITALETDIELKAILADKDYISRYRMHDETGDFLTHRKGKYELILMNPPFSTGDKHLFHAWDILEKGERVCLLNKETYDNPYTKSRMRLRNIIDDYGTVEYLGQCFKGSERTTDVEVLLVHLKKEKSADKFHRLFDNLH